MVSQKMGGAWAHELPGGEIPTDKNMDACPSLNMCLSCYSFWGVQFYQSIRTNTPTDDTD